MCRVVLLLCCAELYAVLSRFVVEVCSNVGSSDVVRYVLECVIVILQMKNAQRTSMHNKSTSVTS